MKGEYAAKPFAVKGPEARKNCLKTTGETS